MADVQNLPFCHVLGSIELKTPVELSRRGQFLASPDLAKSFPPAKELLARVHDIK